MPYTIKPGSFKYKKSNGQFSEIDCFEGPDSPVTDVQINGATILDAQGVANIPLADGSTWGAVKIGSGLYVGATSGVLQTNRASSSQIKAATNNNNPIVPQMQHESIFYGLAKLAGADMSSSSNPVGQFTDDAKSKISDMLNAPISISGTTPSITGKSGLQYICGEASTLSVVAPSSGCIDIVFKSGSTPTVLTVTSAKANTIIKWANGFDPTALEANTTYEINILDGEFGVVGSWT